MVCVYIYITYLSMYVCIYVFNIYLFLTHAKHLACYLKDEEFLVSSICMICYYLWFLDFSL